MENKKVKQFLWDNSSNWRVILEYFFYDFWTCKLINESHKNSMCICSVGDSDEKAFDKAEKLMKRILEIKAIDPKLIEPPIIEKPVENRYEFNKFDSENLIGLPFIHPNSIVQIGFKFVEGRMFIVGLSQKTKNGFFIVDEPYPLAEAHGEIVPIKKGEPNNVKRWYYQDSSFTDILDQLAEGEELYHFDDIQVLSGRAGLFIVKEGLVIKTMTLAMA